MMKQTYNDYPVQMVNRLFVTLQSIFDSIIVAHGDNTYSITHMNKAKMERDGTLPRELAVTQDAIDTMEEWNDVNNNHAGDEEMVATPGNLPAIPMAAPFVGDVEQDSVASLSGRRYQSFIQRKLGAKSHY